MELIFDPDTVEGYIAGGCPHLAASSRATRRAYLRSYGRQITTTAPWPPSIRPLRQDYAVVPYSDAEVARLLEVAASQRTTTQRRHLQALLALGLGAGLFPKESSRGPRQVPSSTGDHPPPRLPDNTLHPSGVLELTATTKPPVRSL